MAISGADGAEKIYSAAHFFQHANYGTRPAHVAAPAGGSNSSGKKSSLPEFYYRERDFEMQKPFPRHLGLRP